MNKIRIFLAIVLAAFSLPLILNAYVDEVNGSFMQIEQYRPNYFIFDFFAQDATSKLQFGFKVKTLKGWDLYLGYSQIMFWQFWAESQPFYDLNYNPELFYRFHFTKDMNNDVGLDLGILEHESNGVDGPNTRSWNRSYLRFFQTWSFESGLKFYINLKAWIPYFMDPTNLDIAKYRGLVELNVTWADFMISGWFPDSDLTFRFYPAGQWFFNPIDGALEVTWRFKTGFFPDTLPMWNLQLFWGHAENLKDYAAPPVVKFRIGAGF